MSFHMCSKPPRIQSANLLGSDAFLPDLPAPLQYSNIQGGIVVVLNSNASMDGAAAGGAFPGNGAGRLARLHSAGWRACAVAGPCQLHAACPARPQCHLLW